MAAWHKTLGISAGALALASMIGTPVNAMERWPRWYLGLSGGLTLQEDSDLNGVGELSFDSGTSFSAALGYRPHFQNAFLNSTRWEAELYYSQNDTDKLTPNGGGAPIASNGDLRSTAIMINAFYDIHNASSFTPYVGLGVGGAEVELNGITTGDSEHVFAYQAMTGIGYAPETLPFVDFSLGYRFFATNEAEVNGAELDNMQHNIEFGVHLNF